MRGPLHKGMGMSDVGRLLGCREGVGPPGNLWFIDGEKLAAFLSLTDNLGGSELLILFHKGG